MDGDAGMLLLGLGAAGLLAPGIAGRNNAPPGFAPGVAPGLPIAGRSAGAPVLLFGPGATEPAAGVAGLLD